MMSYITLFMILMCRYIALSSLTRNSVLIGYVILLFVVKSVF